MSNPDMDRLCDEMFERARQYKLPPRADIDREWKELWEEAFPHVKAELGIREDSSVNLVDQHKAEWAAIAQQEADSAARTEAALKAERDERIAAVKRECSPTQFRAVEVLVAELAERGKFTPEEVEDGNAFRAAWILIQNGWIAQV